MRTLGRWLAYAFIMLFSAFIGMVAVGSACQPIFKKGAQVVPSPAFSEGMLVLMNDGWLPANRCGMTGLYVDLSGPLTAIASVAMVALFAVGGFRIARWMTRKWRAPDNGSTLT